MNNYATVHNLRTEPMHPDDVYIGRRGHGHDGYFGNPFPMRSEKDRSSVIARYEQHARAQIDTDPVFRQRVRDLHGKRLFCFCAPKPCHGDVLAQLAAEILSAEITQ